MLHTTQSFSSRGYLYLVILNISRLDLILKSSSFILIVFCTFFFSGCIEPYNPPEINAPLDYLVVDGFINDGNQPTTFKLTRTRKLNDETGEIIEANAIVRVEGENGFSNGLYEEAPGIYSASSLTLNKQEKYRVYIKTNDGKEYASDFVEVKQTPQIDSITWAAKADGLHIYVNTHDANNNTWYYRWEYEETWEFTSAYYSGLKYSNGEIVPRPYDEQIFICWRSEKLKTFLLGTSSKLSEDVISKQEIAYVPPTSEKIRIKYSISAKQYALTKEAYDYWQNLKKNSESLGTLFDPQPSQVSGNIRCLNNPDEPVIGFISANTVEQQRLFVRNSELKKDWKQNNGFETCKTDTLSLDPAEIEASLGGGENVPITGISGMAGPLVGYEVSSRYCVDCTLRGTNIKPIFWE